MAKLQRHHIRYDHLDWTVELTNQMHRTISRIQNTKATPEQYMRVSNFLHALVHEWERMRLELDVGGDYREKRPKDNKNA